MDTITVEQTLINMIISPVGVVLLMTALLMVADVYVQDRKNKEED